jgi:hypothetical protein
VGWGWAVWYPEKAYMVSNDTKDDGFLNAMDTYVQHTTGIFWINIMGTSFNDRYNLAGPQYRPLRGTEFDDVSLTLAGEVSYAKFDLSEVSKVQALLNIMRTLFICLVLGCVPVPALPSLCIFFSSEETCGRAARATRG